jgi:hypothetical protein
MQSNPNTVSPYTAICGGILKVVVNQNTVSRELMFIAFMVAECVW